ncbi:MAG: hypothetical protein ACRECV_10740 [Xanthobacteraceae bacterium]
MKAARVGLLVEDKRADGDLAAMAAAVNADILVFVGEPPSEVILPSVEVYRKRDFDPIDLRTSDLCDGVSSCGGVSPEV